MRGQRVWWIGGLIVVAVLVIAIGATVLSKGPRVGKRRAIDRDRGRLSPRDAGASNWGRWGPDDEPARRI